MSEVEDSEALVIKKQVSIEVLKKNITFFKRRVKYLTDQINKSKNPLSFYLQEKSALETAIVLFESVKAEMLSRPAKSKRFLHLDSEICEVGIVIDDVKEPLYDW